VAIAEGVGNRADAGEAMSAGAYAETMEHRRLRAVDRRAVGAVLLAAVLFTAAVLPGLTGKQVAGSPIAESIPGAPTAGQCVLAPPAFPTGTSGGGTLRASVLTYGACDGRHFGEVVKVLQADGSVPAEGPLDYSYSRACGPAAVDYLGLGSLLPGSTHAKDLWWPVLYDGATAGIPDSHQQQGGQHWVACTLIPRATKANPSGYREPTRGRLRSGPAPEGLGLCGDSPVAELNDGGSCDAPHRLQILGEAGTTNASSVSELTATCERLVHAVTRMPDVTARGRLRITVTFLTWSGSAGILTAAAPIATGEQQSASCALEAVGPARLTGSLLGAGSNPVPLTG